MGAKAGDGGGGVQAGELELDVAVESVEALVAGQLRAVGTEQPIQRLRGNGAGDP